MNYLINRIRLALKQKSLLALGAFFLLLFILLTLLVRADILRQFDFNTTVRLQDDVALRLDPFFSFLSVIGRFEWTTTLLVILLVVKRNIIGGIVTFGFWGFAHVLELIGKTILEQPGPPRMFLRSQFSDFPGLHVFTDASYPSGHSLRIVFLGILLVFFLFQFRIIPNIVKAIITGGISAIVFVMLISRVSLGEHWATDVIGGTFLGASMAFLSLPFFSKKS